MYVSSLNFMHLKIYLSQGFFSPQSCWNEMFRHVFAKDVIEKLQKRQWVKKQCDSFPSGVQGRYIVRFSCWILELNSDSVEYDFKVRLCYPLRDNTQATATLHRALEKMHWEWSWPWTTPESCIQIRLQEWKPCGINRGECSIKTHFNISKCLFLGCIFVVKCILRLNWEG